MFSTNTKKYANLITHRTCRKIITFLFTRVHGKNQLLFIENHFYFRSYTHEIS